MLTLDLPEDVYNRLEMLSLSTGRSMTFYAMEALLEHLDEIEEQYLPIISDGGQFGSPLTTGTTSSGTP